MDLYRAALTCDSVWQATWDRNLLVTGVDWLQAVLSNVLQCFILHLVHVASIAGLIFVNGGEG